MDIQTLVTDNQTWQENGCNSVYNVGVDGHTNFSDRQPDRA